MMGRVHLENLDVDGRLYPELQCETAEWIGPTQCRAFVNTVKIHSN